MPDTLVRFRMDLEDAIGRDLDRRRRRTRVARPLAGAVVLAAVGGALASTLLGGGGRRSSTAPRPRWPFRAVRPCTW
jgi:hypothetical protein